MTSTVKDSQSTSTSASPAKKDRTLYFVYPVNKQVYVDSQFVGLITINKHMGRVLIANKDKHGETVVLSVVRCKGTNTLSCIDPQPYSWCYTSQGLSELQAKVVTVVTNKGNTHQVIESTNAESQGFLAYDAEARRCYLCTELTHPDVVLVQNHTYSLFSQVARTLADPWIVGTYLILLGMMLFIVLHANARDDSRWVRGITFVAFLVVLSVVVLGMWGRRQIDETAKTVCEFSMNAAQSPTPSHDAPQPKQHHPSCPFRKALSCDREEEKNELRQEEVVLHDFS